MKKIFKTTMAFVAAVTLLSFAGCQKVSKEEVNPTYDGDAVKTQFSISMPGQLKNKMAYSTVQEAQTIASFRGMSDIVLIPYMSTTDRTTRLGDNITLRANTLAQPTGTANTENSIPNGKLLANSNAVLYNDVTIPLRTAGFLFYGRATGADGYANGALTVTGMSNTDEAADITFTPKPIVETVTTTKGEALATYVSTIAAAKYSGTVGGSAGDVCWYMFADATNYGTEAWFNPAIGDLYAAFITLKAGSSSHVQAAVQDLYSSLYAGTSDIAVAIKNAIKTSTYADDSNNDGVLEFTAAISNYPGGDNNSMPDGTAALSWSAATPAVATAQTAATNNGMTQDMTKIVYPASLWYTANSTLKVANESRLADYDGTNNWTTILAGYDDGTSVAASTRSVAIVDPIQYAVGRLDTKVNKLNAAAYYDRKGAVVTVPTEGFQLTGVLIGGQKAVNYAFVQDATATEYTIYDNVINTENSVSAYATTTTDAGVNYTLALPTTADQQVYVALEFMNDGTGATDFQGYDGVCKKGCKFYMIARLNPTTGTGYSSGTMDQVFMADHKTIANFTISAGVPDANGDGEIGAGEGTPSGFANAYVTIPDLRTPQLELGFSVDLTWEAGLTFSVEF